MTLAPQRPPYGFEGVLPPPEPAEAPGTTIRPEAPRAGGLEALLQTFQLQGRLVSLLSAEGRPHSLNATEVLALVVLDRGPMPVSGIARAVGVRPNGASVLVDRLKERRLVRRQRSRRDNRVVTVDLTDAGRELAAMLTASVSKQATVAFGPLAPDEIGQFIALIERLGCGSLAVA